MGGATRGAEPQGSKWHVPLIEAVNITSLSKVPRSNNFTVEHDSLNTTTEPDTRQHRRPQLNTHRHTHIHDSLNTTTEPDTRQHHTHTHTHTHIVIFPEVKVAKFTQT